MNQVSVCTRNTNKKRHRAILVAQTFALVILLSVGMSSNVATLLTVALLCLCYLFMNASEITSSMLFFYPLYCLFKFNGNGISYYNVLIVVATICLMTNHCSREDGRLHLRINKNVVWMFALCVYVSIISLMYGQASALLSVVLDLFIPLLFVGAVVNHKDIDITSAIYAFSLGVICSGLVGGEMLPINNLGAYVDTFGYRVAGVRLIRLQGVTVNPNYYSLDINLALAGLLALPQMQQRKTKKSEWVLIVLLSIFGVMSLSKSFVFGVIATLVFLVLFSGDLKRIIVLLAGLGVAGVIISVLYTYDNAYVLAVFDRLGAGTSSMEAMTSSRSAIWNGYLKYLFFENPLSFIIGNGIGAGAPETIGRESHSFFIETVYYLGAIGIVLLLAFLCSFVRKWKRSGIQYLPLAIFLVRATGINLLLREAFMICLIIIVLFINYEKDFDTL